MTIVCNTRNSEDQINRIYKDYDLAYIGERFYESFKKWNYSLYFNMRPILSGMHTAILPGGYLQYAYPECTITYTKYCITGVYIIVTHKYNFNQRVLAGVPAGTQSERTSLGMTRSSAAATTPSAMRQSDYIEVGEENYGTLFGDKVVLLKKKGRRK